MKGRVALQRIAEALASQDSHGYPWLYGRYLEHYLGGRPWDEEWDKSQVQDARGGDYHDARGPARKWWQHRSAAS